MAEIITAPVIRKITANLREYGYSGITPEQVADQLRKLESERDIIGQFAAKMLLDNGVEEWEVSYP